MSLSSRDKSKSELDNSEASDAGINEHVDDDPFIKYRQHGQDPGSQRNPGPAEKEQEDFFPDESNDMPHRFSRDEKEDEEPLIASTLPESSSSPPPKNDKPVSWASLPRKGQLAILTFARFSEPLAQTSLMAYMFYQLRWFDPSLPDSTISWQAGILQASFSAAQFFTAALWGKAADHIGRKPVVLIGLTGLCLSCFAYAFSTSFVLAVVIRSAGGALNGNVGLMRTMISEIVPEKKYQSRAFLLLPTFLNIGGILGPIIGGFFADPFNNLPRIFGPNSLFGGSDGISWMERWPYALPNLLTGTVLLTAITLVFLGLEETHEQIKHRPDRGRQIARYFQSLLSIRRSQSRYILLNNDPEINANMASENTQTINPNGSDPSEKEASPSDTPKPSFRQIWTRNVVLSLASHFFLIFNIATFNALLFTFLPTPRSSPATSSAETSTSHLSGGLGLSESNVGLATALIGLLGFPLQLLLYPALQSRFGTLRCYKLFLPSSAIAAFLTPLLVRLPNRPWATWPSLVVVLALEVLARTLALPGSIILINESVPMARVKGLVHGVGQSVASAGKTVGPVLGGWGLSMGLQHNAVGAVWWALGGVTLFGWVCAWAIREKKEDENAGTV
ncbi:MFS general substrate transporter [Viridothelium virens]|uniref:MFS general substrate transporter n=1 Tax=Viridothelium virens TaxID=1048519 RepID=A0A6A6HDI7_VIRVR|nr:MFS general substrate transporter [Viridothelium virens]